MGTTYSVDQTLKEIQMLPESETNEVLQNLKTILSTEQGSAPMCRDIGISGETIHRRATVAQVLLTRDIFEAVHDQEKRAELKNVRYGDTHNDGALAPVLEVQINGG